MIVPEWTQAGAEAIRNQKFWYLSAEFLRKWTDPQKREFKNVLIGAAVTNNPFFKGMQEVTLSEELADQLDPQNHTEETTVPDPTQTTEGAASGSADPTPPATPAEPVVTTATEPAAPTPPVNLSETYVSRDEYIRLNERLIASERRERISEFRETFAHWNNGTRESNAEMMLALSETVSEQLFTEVRDRIEALERQVAQGALFSSLGTTRPAASTPAGRLEAAFAEAKGKNPDKADDDLWVIVASEHPDLYAQYRRGFINSQSGTDA